MSRQGAAPFLSIVIPARDEEHRLPATLRRIRAHLAEQPFAAEVLVVDDGSRDATREVVRESARRDPSVRLLEEPAVGKGNAVRRGMLAARGAHRALCDADLSVPIAEITRLLDATREGVDVAAASREAPGSERIGEPLRRHLLGRAFHLLVRSLLPVSLEDTQCGFKCFRGAAAEAIFSRTRRTGFAFDVEVLLIAQRLGLRVREIGVPWHFDPDTRVRPVRDAIAMATDLLRIRADAARGRYDAPGAEGAAEGARAPRAPDARGR